MSTPNYITQRDFDLYVCTYEYPTEEQAKEQYVEIYGSDENFSYNDFIDTDIEWFYNSEYDNLKWLTDKVNKDLKFFQIDLQSGYYDGIQTFINKQDYWNNFYFKNLDNFEIDNEDSNYYFGVCRSVLYRQMRSEINKINKKILPYLKDNSSLNQIECVGVFSNGEAVYKLVA